jgi:hypothetical protein
MKLLSARSGHGYYVIVQCTLVGKDGREKALVRSGGSEQTILRERQERVKVGWKVERAMKGTLDETNATSLLVL